MGIHHVWIDDERWYENDATKKKVPGVSAILGQYPKDKLTAWAAKMAAFYVVDNFDKVSQLIASDKGKAVRLIKTAHTRSAKKKADAGTSVHTSTEIIARAIIAGTKPKGAVPKDDMPYLKQYVRFLKEFEVEPVMVETIVWDEEVGFAGRLDLAGILHSIDDKLCIIDTKSGESGIWENAALQQTAYSYASHYIDPDTDEMKPMPETHRAYGLWLRPEGYALQPLATTAAEWEQFQHLRASLEWKRTRAKKVVGKAINENPIKRQWKGPNA